MRLDVTTRRYDLPRKPRTLFARRRPPPCIIRPEYRGAVGALRALSERFGHYFADVDPVAFVRELRGEDEGAD